MEVEEPLSTYLGNGAKQFSIGFWMLKRIKIHNPTPQCNALFIILHQKLQSLDFLQLCFKNAKFINELLKKIVKKGILWSHSTTQKNYYSLMSKGIYKCSNISSNIFLVVLKIYHVFDSESERCDMSIRELLLQWASTINIQLSVLVYSTKRTSSSSQWKLTCHDIAAKLLSWQ
jgi:hypothetical protein